MRGVIREIDLGNYTGPGYNGFTASIVKDTDNGQLLKVSYKDVVTEVFDIKWVENMDDGYDRTNWLAYIVCRIIKISYDRGYKNAKDSVNEHIDGLLDVLGRR